MNKTEIDYFKSRIEGHVMCVNGQVATKLQAQKRTFPRTENFIHEQLGKNNCELLSFEQIEDNLRYWRPNNPNLSELIDKLFVIPKVKDEKRISRFNKSIDNRINEIASEISAVGKILIDKLVLSLVPKKDIPEEIDKLSEMISLANIKIPKWKG